MLNYNFISTVKTNTVNSITALAAVVYLKPYRPVFCNVWGFGTKIILVQHLIIFWLFYVSNPITR